MQVSLTLVLSQRARSSTCVFSSVRPACLVKARVLWPNGGLEPGSTSCKRRGRRVGSVVDDDDGDEGREGKGVAK